MKIKTFIIAAVCLLFCVTDGFAQASTMSAEELRFRNGIEQFLKEEGYVPTIDDDDNSLNFKKEGSRYWLTVEDSSPTYIELHLAGFSMDSDDDRAKMMEACNKACLETKCAKAYLNTSSVSFSVEVFCQTLEGFKNIFYRSVSVLDTAKDKVKKYYNE